MDCVALATRAAFRDTRLPKTVVEDVGDGQLDFEVVDDLGIAERLKGWEHVPVCATVCQASLFLFMKCLSL